MQDFAPFTPDLLGALSGPPTPGRKDHLASEVGKTGQPNNFLDNLNFDDYQIFLGVSNTDTVIVFIFLYFF